MYWMRKIKLVVFLSFCFCLKVSSQVNLDFVKHLSFNQLKEEHFFYLANSGTSSDSIHYLTAKYYLQYHNDSLFFKHLHASADLSSGDSLLLNNATIYYFKQSNKYTQEWVGFMTEKVNYSCRSKQFIDTLLKNDPGNINLGFIQLNGDMANYKKAMRKKPVVAAAMSAIIPGLGKAYIGRKKSFGFTLAAHLLYGIQTYESIKRLGIKNPLSIINIGMLGVMYSANIYGSFIEAKKNKKEKYHQLLNHASDYLYMDTGNSLYP